MPLGSALLAGGALFAVALLTGLSLAGRTAQATFPGDNGRIACEGDRAPQPTPAPSNFAPTEILTVNPDGSDERVLTSNLVTDGDPAFSPDGKQIAFNSTRDGDSEIYTMNVDGTDVKRLTTSPGTDRQPTWSPDGSRMVFHSGRDRNPDGSINFEVYVMNADGSNQTNLTNLPGQDAVPSWSPDGTRIAFQSLRAGNLEIHTMNADGTAVRNLTNNPGAPGARNTAEDISPNWSPDSNQIVFASGRNSTRAGFVNYEIYRLNAADGSGLTRLTDNPATGPDSTDFDNFPNWSPDGTRIVFNSGREGLGPQTVHAFTMNAADGSDVRRVALQAGDNRSACDWDRIVRAAAAPPPALAAGACANRKIGTERDDTIAGTIAGDRIDALGGHDRVDGLQGDDCLSGARGRDRLAGALGNDRLSGGADRDSLSGGGGVDSLSGGAAKDKLNGGGNRDSLSGGSGPDQLSGASDNDRLTGGSGNDRLAGGSGRNRYSAGAGNDRVLAANGHNERINCGSGRRDTALADRRDRVRGCERVRRLR